MNINYGIIASAISFYKKKGYHDLHVSWFASHEVIEHTLPEFTEKYSVLENDKCLIGSAEQSFIQLLLENKLPIGKVQATSPCFRNEEEDEAHVKHFIKTELILTGKVNDRSLEEVIGDAFAFFRITFPPSRSIYRFFVLNVEQTVFHTPRSAVDIKCLSLLFHAHPNLLELIKDRIETISNGDDYYSYRDLLYWRVFIHSCDSLEGEMRDVKTLKQLKSFNKKCHLMYRRCGRIAKLWPEIKEISPAEVLSFSQVLPETRSVFNSKVQKKTILLETTIWRVYVFFFILVR